MVLSGINHSDKTVFIFKKTIMPLRTTTGLSHYWFSILWNIKETVRKKYTGPITMLDIRKRRPHHISFALYLSLQYDCLESEEWSIY